MSSMLHILLTLLLFSVISIDACCTPTMSPINKDSTLDSNTIMTLQQDHLIHLLYLIEYTLVKNNCPITSTINPTQPIIPSPQNIDWGGLQPQVNALIASAQACRLNLSLLQDVIRISMNYIVAQCQVDAIRNGEQQVIKDEYPTDSITRWGKSSWAFNNNVYPTYTRHWSNKLGYDINGRIGLYGPLFPFPIPSTHHPSFPFSPNNIKSFNNDTNDASDALQPKQIIPKRCKDAPALPPPPPPYT